MRIGCIFTARNEEGLIRQNINYHRFLGVTDFFVFLDHSTDRTKSLIHDIPSLRIFENLGYLDLLPYSLDKPDLDLELMSERFAAHNGIRQIFHANMALELCRTEKIDWLIHLDPDELICLDNERVAKDGLKDYLSGLDKNLGAVIFRNLEAVPTQFEPENVFDDLLFKTEPLDGELNGLPKTKMFNPYTGGHTTAGWFWGHTSGKLAARVLPGAYFGILLSHFHTTGDVIKVPYLLHYNIFSFSQFIAKYKNFKNFPKYTSLGRKVRPLRTLFVDLVNDSENSDDQLAQYFREHILYTREDIEIIREKHPSAFIEIHSVADFVIR